MNSEFTQVDVIRHGACEGGEMLRGKTDVPLSAEGWQQMQNTVDAARENANWEVIISSPLGRCTAFSEDLAKRCNISMEVNPLWREVDFGEWDGKLIKDLQKTDADKLQRYFVTPTEYTPPGAEPFAEVYKRIVEAWVSSLKKYQHKRILIVTHSLSIRLLLSHIMQAPLDSAACVHVPYASISRIHVYHDGEKTYPNLIAHNNWNALHV